MRFLPPALPAAASRFARYPTLEGLRDLLRPEDRLFPLLAVIIGLYAGLAVVCFRVAIEWCRVAFLGSAPAPPWPRVVLVPAAMGLAAGLLIWRVFPRARGSGVGQTKAALYIYDGYIPSQTVLGKFLGSALAIGGGHSLGPEDPSLQIGAGLASALGRALRLSRDRLRLIAPMGAAAGLGAAFNAPISAVLFVIEEVIGRWSAGVLGPVVLAAVSSVVVARFFLGTDPLFVVPPYELVRPAELLGYAVLGIVGGLASLAFVKLVLSLRARLRTLPSWTIPLQPAVAGLLVGTVGIWLPQVMGAGYDTIDQAMHDRYAWPLLLALGIGKITATALSFGSGTPGGLFAPSLFMGAMIGGAVGELAATAFPFGTAPSGIYALVGMGTFFAGGLRAPMTSAFMILEVSGNYSIIIPVMVSNTIAYVISRRLQPVPLFDAVARQEGLDLPSMERLRELRTLRVEDAMRPPGGPLLARGHTVGQALDHLGPSAPYAIVHLGPGAWRVASREALERSAAAGQLEAALPAAVGAEPLPVLHPDEPLERVLEMIEEGAALPVVHRADATRLEGLVTLEDVLRAYRLPTDP